MNNQRNPSPTRVRIYSHVTQSRFLHVEDAFNIGKIRLFAGSYRKGHGMNANGHAHHFIDLDDARAIFWALLCAEQGFSHKEYKGTPPQGENQAVSRILSIVVKGDNVYIELKSGPGKLTHTGAITPNGPTQVEVNVAFKLHDARRMAASVLAYIQSWDVLRILAHKQIVGQPAPYLLVATSSENNDTPKVTIESKSGEVRVNGNGELQTNLVNGRPITRKNGIKPKDDLSRPANGKLEDKQPMKYGNGALVDGENVTEVQTFERYLLAKNTVPESKIVLLDFYRQQA